MAVDQNQGQGSPSPVGTEQVVAQGQASGQDEDSNDEEIPPRNNKLIEIRRKARAERNLELRGHTLDEVVRDLRRRVSTRRELASFSDHRAHISMVEPKKVFEALEDLDWVASMHEELTNFEHHKV